MIKLAYDVMGSDNGASAAVNAGLKFLQDKDDLILVFFGNEEEIRKVIEESEFKVDSSKYEIKNTTEVIDMHGSILDIRRKKDASIVRALEAVKEGTVDGMLTGGSSAAFIAGAQTILGNIEGVTRSGFMPTIPTLVANKTVLLLDAGANIENTPEDLVNYANMASVYSKAVNGIKEPLVGLMNIGEEETKGKQLHKDAYKMLKENKNINFYGNLEPREITSGEVDILVTDGFTGNIALKSIEGMAKNLMMEIKNEITSSFIKKLHALGLKKSFKAIARKFDYKNHAGAILLGIDGIVFKSHGSSDIKSFNATLRMTYDAVKNDVLNKLKEGMSKL